MIIRCWGVRGSIPVSGKPFLHFGGDTTCLEIETGSEEVIIVDAGSGIRCLGNQLLEQKRRHIHIIFTHAHLDHILGFPFFKPLYCSDTHITVYGCSFFQESLEDILTKAINPPYFPVNFAEFKAKVTFSGSCRSPFTVGPLRVTPIPLNHPNGGMGYKFKMNGKSFVFLTDNELSYTHPGSVPYNQYLSFCRGADLLFHDGEFTDTEYISTRGWGHSTYKDALTLALEAQVTNFGLFHHNQDRTDDALNQIVQECRTITRGKNSSTNCFAVFQGMEIEV